MEDMLNLIHSELSGFREDMKELGGKVAESNERLAKIEASLRPLFDNGQPGWLSRMQTQINANTAFRMKAMGALAVLSFVNVGTVLAVIKFLLDNHK